MSAARCASNVRPSELSRYSCDEVAHWLCEVGFRDYTAGFLERNVTGQKLLELKQFQVKSYFPRDVDRASQFWNLLEAVRNNAQPSLHANRFGRPTLPPPRGGSFPPVPGMGRYGRPLPPPAGQGYIDNPDEDYIQNISSMPPAFAQPPMGGPPFTNIHSTNRMPPLSGPEITDQEDYLTFEPSLCTEQLSNTEPSPINIPGWRPSYGYDKPQLPPGLPPFQKPSPSTELKKKKYIPSYDDHTLPFRPPPQPPRPQERKPSSKSVGHSPVTSRPPSVKDTLPFHPHSYERNNRNADGHSPVSSRPASVKDSSPLHPHSYDWNNRIADGHSPVTSRTPSLKDMAPFHSHIPDRKHNRSTDSASSTSSEDLTMIPRPMVATGQSTPFSKQSKMPTKFPPHMNRGPFNASAMPPLDTNALSFKPADNTDISKPTEDQPWFMNTSREGAQRAIEAKKQSGVFVVRPKQESNFQPYALTLWANGTFKNLVIRRKPDGEFALGSKKEGELSFKTVVAMVDYYQKHELNIADSNAITLISGP